MSEPIHIYEMALAAGRKAEEGEEGRESRTLDILFYGMCCFDPLSSQPGYRVLFPNGLEERGGIAAHSAGIWVRKRDAVAAARWPWMSWRNDFFIAEPGVLTISGLVRTAFEDSKFNGRVTNLRDCDPDFRLAAKPDSVIDMIVDHGILSAHQANEEGMIVARWRVVVERGATVRFQFNDKYVDVPPEATQVFLANASDESGGPGDTSHFMLYRRLSTDPEAPLPFRERDRAPEPLGTLQLDEPTFGNRPRRSGLRLHALAKRTRARVEDEGRDPTPYVVCSCVQTRVRDVDDET